MHKEIMAFLKELKYSHKDMGHIFMNGSCFRLFKMLQAFIPEAVPMYSDVDGGHWITRVNLEGMVYGYYDINGQLSEKYVKDKKYKSVRDPIVLASAHVPTEGSQGSRYSKYVETH